jgi:hypothetical protein
MKLTKHVVDQFKNRVFPTATEEQVAKAFDSNMFGLSWVIKDDCLVTVYYKHDTKAAELYFKHGSEWGHSKDGYDTCRSAYWKELRSQN